MTIDTQELLIANEREVLEEVFRTKISWEIYMILASGNLESELLNDRISWTISPLKSRVLQVLNGEESSTFDNIKLQELTISLAQELIEELLSFQNDIKKALINSWYKDLVSEYEKALYFPTHFEWVVRWVVEDELEKINRDPDGYSLTLIIPDSISEPGVNITIDKVTDRFIFTETQVDTQTERKRSILDYMTDDSSIDEAGDDMKIDIITKWIIDAFYEKFWKRNYSILNLEELKIQWFSGRVINKKYRELQLANTVRI